MERENKLLRYEKLKSELKKELFGQNEAIEGVVDALLHLALTPRKEPYKGFFGFFGPHNSGKVYLAELLAKYCEEFESIAIFDMAEFTDPADQKKLIGEEGQLENFIKKHPRSIVLFKDIEKCDNTIQLALLNFIKMQSEEEGLDRKGILFVFTSTLGSSLITKDSFWKFYKKEPLKAQAKLVEYIAKEKKVIYDIVESAIDAELLSLMAQNYIILFRHLSLATLYKIAKKTLQNALNQLRLQSDITIKIENKEAFVKLLTLSFTPYLNARRLHRKLPDILLDLILFAVKKSEKVAQSYTIVVDDEAVKLARKIDQSRVSDMVRKNETLTLTWDIETPDTIVLKKATVKRLPLYTDSLQKPALTYSQISFRDVAGQKNVKASLKEILGVIKNPKKVKKFGITMPKGLLLHGPKGVGKSMLALAFCKEASMPYVQLSGIDLSDANLIHSAYQKAKEAAPAIVLLDGLEPREELPPLATDAIINELDAIEEEQVFTIATSSHKELLDKNLFATDRIDIHIEVPELDMEARRYFVKKILQKPNDGKIDIDRVARYMSGLSGYEMQRVAKEAAMFVLRKNLALITEEILIEQINNIKYGSKIDKKRIRNIEKDLIKTAYHEAGHAVLSYILLPDVKIEQVTITPRSQALGFVSYSDEEITNLSKEELFNDICVALAGRIAKLKKFPDEGVDTGAAQDLEQATWEAYNAIANFGMDEEVGYINIDTLNQNVSKDLFKDVIERRILVWIEEATKKAEEYVERYWDKIEKVAQELVKKELIDAKELEKIMKS
jgi:ATP-dependent Zn protease